MRRWIIRKSLTFSLEVYMDAYEYINLTSLWSKEERLKILEYGSAYGDSV